MRKIWISILLFAPLASQAVQLSQNDVSILIPLPKSQEEDSLFRPSTPGKFGELLPKRVYDEMPKLAFEAPDATYEKLRVVSVRIDPCFPAAPPATGCKAQIRMAWQPLAADPLGGMRSIDAAVHTFYDLPGTDFPQLVTELENLKSSIGSSIQDESLSVNPQLSLRGLSSSYASELFSILLSKVGASRLSQATFMQLSGAENVWVFGGFLVSGETINRLPIPRIPGLTQVFLNNPSNLNPTYFSNGSINPAPRGADTFNLLVRDSRNLTQADEPEVIEGVMSAVRIENPNRHNVHTMDCVSCHTAQIVRVWADRQFPWLNLEPRAYPFKFQSPFNLSNKSPHQENTKIVRAFGYMGSEPAISQRTINETAQVLEKLYPAFTKHNSARQAHN